MNINKNPIPFESMPKNIEELLTPDDYMYATLHPAGMMRGIYEVIHLNELYPQWHNVIIPDDAVDQICVYTKNGWVKKYFEGDIWNQFNDEYINCFTYLTIHLDKMYNRDDEINDNIKTKKSTNIKTKKI